MKKLLKKYLFIILVVSISACSNSKNQPSSDDKGTDEIILEEPTYIYYNDFDVVDFGSTINVDLDNETIGTGGALYVYKIYETTKRPQEYWEDYKAILIESGFESDFSDTVRKPITWNGEMSELTVRIVIKPVVDLDSYLKITVVVSYKDI